MTTDGSNPENPNKLLEEQIDEIVNLAESEGDLLASQIDDIMIKAEKKEDLYYQAEEYLKQADKDLELILSTYQKNEKTIADAKKQMANQKKSYSPVLKKYATAEEIIEESELQTIFDIEVYKYNNHKIGRKGYASKMRNEINEEAQAIALEHATNNFANNPDTLYVFNEFRTRLKQYIIEEVEVLKVFGKKVQNIEKKTSEYNRLVENLEQRYNSSVENLEQRANPQKTTEAVEQTTSPNKKGLLERIGEIIYKLKSK